MNYLAVENNQRVTIDLWHIASYILQYVRIHCIHYTISIFRFDHLMWCKVYSRINVLWINTRQRKIMHACAKNQN